MDEDPGGSPVETQGQLWDMNDYAGSSFDANSIESPEITAAFPMAREPLAKRPLGENVERPDSKRCRYTLSG